VRCRFAYGPADATATHYLAAVNPDWFYLSVTGSPGSPGQNPESRKTIVVVVVEFFYLLLYWTLVCSNFLLLNCCS